VKIVDRGLGDRPDSGNCHYLVAHLIDGRSRGDDQFGKRASRFRRKPCRSRSNVV
jgi:hypothetical protein